MLGQALARLGLRDEGLAALRSAVEIADDLIGAPAAFVPTLAPERATSVLDSPTVTQIRSAAGRSSVD